MSVEDRLFELAKRVQGMSVAGFSERETEQYLVGPFLGALGYDIHNPAVVQMQLPIQMGSTTKNCDYAIKLHDEVRILLECKRASMPLDDAGQLASYFSQVPTALLGIYTNGIEYRFYVERNRERVKQMDKEPLLVLDLHDLEPTALQALSTCKDRFDDPQGYLQWIDELRDVRVIEERLRGELMGRPSDELVYLAMDWVGAKEKTPDQIKHFRDIVSAALRDILHRTSNVVPQPPAQPVPALGDTQQQEVTLDQAPKFIRPRGANTPVALKFRDGKVTAVKSWRHMMEEIAYWLYKEGHLNSENCEVQSVTHPSRKILSQSEDAFRWGGAPVKTTSIRMDTQYGGTQFVLNACKLLQVFGEDPSQVYLRLPVQ